MILLVDSGASKAEWAALNARHEKEFITETLGLNPEVVSKEVILERINNNPMLSQRRKEVKKILFYGAGCGTGRMQNFVKEVLKGFFSNSVVEVEEDTYGAVYATIEGGQPAIVCILGTGSNCSYWDGKKLNQKVESLGYILMDDCSGNYFGKRLVRDYYFNKMPKHIAKDFSEKFSMDPDAIKESIYQLPNPNRYLAAIGGFILSYKTDPYGQKIIAKGIKSFIRNYILQYKQADSVPIHFVGGIAYNIKDELKRLLEAKGLRLGNVVRRPIDGMVSHYQAEMISHER